jgi:hypothetical protein
MLLDHENNPILLSMVTVALGYPMLYFLVPHVRVKSSRKMSFNCAAVCVLSCLGVCRVWSALLVAQSNVRRYFYVPLTMYRSNCSLHLTRGADAPLAGELSR